MLPIEIKLAIADRLTSTELIEFLNPDINDVIEIFEEEILTHLSEVLDLINYSDNNDE